MNPECSTAPLCNDTPPPVGNISPPLLVGDALHILSRRFSRALTDQDEDTLADLAREQLACGARALAVNPGPGRASDLQTPWVVQTLRRQTDVPLFFSANILTHHQLLDEFGRGMVINAVTAEPGELKKAMMTAVQHGCALVVLLVRSGMKTGGIDGKILLADQVLEAAAQTGFPLSRLYLDPVMACRPDPSSWLVSRGMPDVSTVIETIGLIRQLDCTVKTIVAAGNGTEGMARDKRAASRARILRLLVAAGVDAVLLNCSDLDSGWWR